MWQPLCAIKIGWHGAFITAGIGMFLGVITFWLGMKHYKHVDVRKEPKPEDKPFLMQFVKVLLMGVAFAAIGWIVPNAILGNGKEPYTIMGSQSTDAFFMFCIPVIYFYSSIFKKANTEERNTIRHYVYYFHYCYFILGNI